MKRIIIIGTEPLIIIEIPYYHIVTARPTGNRLQQAKKCAPIVGPFPHPPGCSFELESLLSILMR